MLSEALVFGCARLAGGAEARASRALVRLCLDRGVRWFDTAPSYGMGMAEAMVGEEVGGRPDVGVTVKVGSAPPRFALARSLVRRIRGQLGLSRPTLVAPFQPIAVPGAGGGFDRDRMARSLSRSLARLRRSRADLLLLHEAAGEDATPEVLAFLDEARATGQAERVGYSHGAMVQARTDARFPACYHAQIAIAPDWFGAAAGAPARSLTLHSLAKTGRWLAATDERFAGQLARAAATMPGDDPAARQIGCLFALAHLRLPCTRLIFASTHCGRTAAFLDVVRHLDADGGLDAVARAFATEWPR